MFRDHPGPPLRLHKAKRSGYLEIQFHHHRRVEAANQKAENICVGSFEAARLEVFYPGATSRWQEAFLQSEETLPAVMPLAALLQAYRPAARQEVQQLLPASCRWCLSLSEFCLVAPDHRE